MDSCEGSASRHASIIVTMSWLFAVKPRSCENASVSAESANYLFLKHGGGGGSGDCCCCWCLKHLDEFVEVCTPIDLSEATQWMIAYIYLPGLAHTHSRRRSFLEHPGSILSQLDVGIRIPRHKFTLPLPRSTRSFIGVRMMTSPCNGELFVVQIIVVEWTTVGRLLFSDEIVPFVRRRKKAGWSLAEEDLSLATAGQTLSRCGG